MPLRRVDAMSCAPTADSTACPQLTESNRSSQGALACIAVRRALLQTASFGLDKRVRTGVIQFPKPRDKPRLAQQPEIVRDCRRVPRFLKLPHHLLIRKYLPGIIGNVAKLGMDTSPKCKGLLSGVAYGSPIRVRSQYP